VINIYVKTGCLTASSKCGGFRLCDFLPWLHHSCAVLFRNFTLAWWCTVEMFPS